jgi:hypothetical protein
MMEKEKSIGYIWLAVAVGGVALLAGGIYLYQFSGNGLSPNSEDWANFATYISGTVGVAAVVATLIAFVITLKQQQDLVKNQRIMLEKQEEQLGIEKNKQSQVVVEKERRERRTAIYLLHQFEVLGKFYCAAQKALAERDPKIWLALAKRNPSTYPYLLMNETVAFLSLINHINGKMTLDCLGAVNLATELARIFEGTLSEDCLAGNDLHNVIKELEQLDMALFNHAQSIAQAGADHCQKFLAGSRDMLDKEKQLLISEL